MQHVEVAVGIDISKDWLEVAVVPDRDSFRLRHDAAVHREGEGDGHGLGNGYGSGIGNGGRRYAPTRAPSTSRTRSAAHSTSSRVTW